MGDIGLFIIFFSFFVLSLLLIFRNKKTVDGLIATVAGYYRKQGYTEAQIHEWTFARAKRYYLFYKLLGIFGLFVTSIGIIVLIKPFLDAFLSAAD